MAPTYKPLTSAGGLTGAPGLPPEVFGAPQVRTIDDILREQEALRAQELANQSNEVMVAERQRIANEGEARRQAIRDQFGDQPTESFNPDEALSVIQRLSIQQGDLDTALAIERTQKERKGSAAYSPEERAILSKEFGYDLPEGISPSFANTLINLKGKNLYEQQINDPLLLKNREWNSILKEQQATGTQIRPPTSAQVAKFGAGDAFIQQMEDMEARYLPYISENRGERLLAAAVNPNSAAARLLGELNLAAKQAALSLEDRVTDQDYKTIQEIALPNDLDTMETARDRMARLKQFIRRRNDADLNAMQSGGFNTEGLRNRNQILIPRVGQGQESLPPLANYGPSDLSAYTPAQLQFMRSKGMIK